MRNPLSATTAVWRSAQARRRVERAEVRRFTRHRRARRRGWLIAGSVVALFAVVLVLALFTPLMSVRNLRVEGTEHLTDDELTAALEPLQGRPLAQVSNEDVEALLQPFVLVQSYSVQRMPPSTLVVRVVERIPVGIHEHDGVATVVDAAGVMLWDVGSEQDPGGTPALPVIDVADLHSAAFQAAGRVSYALAPDFRAQVAAISAASPEDVRLRLSDGAEVIWGSADDSYHKTAILESLRTATAGSSVHVYDVSSPDTPVTR